ncbi:MAG: hypothetical protein JWN67_662 [Actinomycetia bacterium]|nr:hypothetical protein [Actinomycetes bacterium]
MAMPRFPLVLVLPLLVVAVACGSDSPTTASSGDPSAATSTTLSPSTTVVPVECSTAGIRIQLQPQEGLPAAVTAKRQAIFDAAVACDYDTLETLAAKDFNYTFGDAAGGAADYWRAREAADEPVMKLLVQILNLPHVARQLPDGGATYVSWPSADQDVRTDADWEALKGVYTDEQVAGFKSSDLYTGYRVAISHTGDWMYFVSGD